MQKTLIALILAATVVLSSGCCSCRDAAESPRFPATEIHYSSGGGVTGMSSGYTILGDGSVLKWSGRADQHDKSENVGRIGDEEYEALIAGIYALKPESLNHQETGNMTTALRIVSDDVVYTYTWPGMAGDDDAVPGELKALRDLVWKSIQTALDD